MPLWSLLSGRDIRLRPEFRVRSEQHRRSVPVVLLLCAQSLAGRQQALADASSCLAGGGGVSRDNVATLSQLLSCRSQWRHHWDCRFRIGRAAMLRTGNAALRLVRISCKTSAARGGSSIDQWMRFEAMNVELMRLLRLQGRPGVAQGGFGGGWRFPDGTFMLGAETERPRQPRPVRAGCGAGTSPIRRRTCRSRPAPSAARDA